MKRLFYLIMTACVLTIGCNSEKQEEKNPLLEKFSTPYEVPPFDQIKLEHYKPAFDVAMQQHNDEIDSIINNQEAPTFENTIVALDRSGELLSKVGGIFFNVYEAESDEAMQNLANTLMPMYTSHFDNITFNDKLFQRVKAVYEQRDSLNLEADEMRVLEKYYRDFTRNGANLTETEKATLKSINEELSVLYLKFEQNLLAENKKFTLVVDKEEELKGLPDVLIATAAKTAAEAGQEGKWMFTMSKASWIPFLQFSENRNLRETIYRGWFMRGNNNDTLDNKANIEKIVNLRLQKANILGFENFAAFKIDNNMAKTQKAVDDLLAEIWTVANPVSIKERDEIQSIIDKEGGNFKMEPWDWWFYAEKIRKEKYNLEESELKPYLTLDNVKTAIFYVANKLYGITFKLRTDIPVYHPDVEVFEANEADGKLIGLLYMDYHPRAGKGSGAWCTDFRAGSYDKEGNRIIPLVSIVCNFTEAIGDTPAMLSWDETTTLFHEFGHGLHALFSDGRFHRTAGEMPRDMVELPSQFMENYAGEPEVLKMYAKHYKTGEIIPDDLIAKIQNSSTFNIGFETCEFLAAAILDQAWHSQKEQQQYNVNDFEKSVLDKIELIPEILPRYRTTYFAHAFGGEGYAAGYYVYTWAEFLDADAFDAFKQSGNIFNPDLAAKFRENVLANSGKDEGMIQYLKFRGQEPSKEPYFKRRGLK